MSKNSIRFKIKRGLLLILSSLALMYSCAKEEVINIDESEDQIIAANSKIANLIKQVSLNDGSDDNIIDRANCLNIQLPVMLVVNGQNITINNIEDFEIIEAIFEEFSDDNDTLEIVFPITIILDDHTPIEINDQNQLDAYIIRCNGENQPDDDIECIDFEYPISASLYNALTELIRDVSISNDAQMYVFIVGLDSNDSASFDFPISMSLFDGSTLEITSLDQLETQIENAEDSCDEDDDFDFDDDDFDDPDLNEQEFSEYIRSCSWRIDEVDIEDQNLENLRGTILTFNQDGTLIAELNGDFSGGVWEISLVGELRLNLTMDTLTELNNNWRLNKIVKEDDDKDQMDFRLGIDVLKLIKNCN